MWLQIKSVGGTKLLLCIDPNTLTEERISI